MGCLQEYTETQRFQYSESVHVLTLFFEIGIHYFFMKNKTNYFFLRDNSVEFSRIQHTTIPPDKKPFLCFYVGIFVGFRKDSKRTQYLS